MWIYAEPPTVRKRCCICGEVKGVAEFGRYCRSPDGWRAACRRCTSARERAQWAQRASTADQRVVMAARKAVRLATRTARANRRQREREAAAECVSAERLQWRTERSDAYIGPHWCIRVTRKGEPRDVLIDAADYERVKQYRVYVLRSEHVAIFIPGVGRCGWGVKGPGRRILLHRFIMGLEPHDARVVDHIHGTPLNNRRSNLRIVTSAQNRQNVRGYGRHSRHRGVSFDSSRGQWMAYSKIPGGRFVSLGRFATEDEAARVAAAFRAEHMPYAVAR